MPVLDPKILSELAARATELAAEVHTNVLMKRSVDHRVLETMAVGKFPRNVLLAYYLLGSRCLAHTLSSCHVYLRRRRLHVLGHQNSKQIIASTTNQAWRSGSHFSIYKDDMICQRAQYHRHKYAYPPGI